METFITSLLSAIAGRAMGGKDETTTEITESTNLDSLVTGATSGETASTEDPLETSFGLASLALEHDDLDEFVQMREEDVQYLRETDKFLANEKTFRRKARKTKLVRRMQVRISSLRTRGYTALRKEVVRREPPSCYVEEIPSSATQKSTPRAGLKKYTGSFC